MRFVSFDIFDTCIIRKCGDPQNLLDILSWSAFRESVDNNVRREFVMARRMADIATYDNAFARLEDIYAAMAYSHPLLKSTDELVQIEKELEREMLVPVSAMLNRISKLRQQGNQILFISDMYLPGEYLSPILKENGLMKSGDKLYVSCDVGKRKASGELYKYIHKKENIPYSSWTHYGDNEKSDYTVPKSLGIHAERIQCQYSPYQFQWFRYEYNPQNRVAETLSGVCRALNIVLPNSPHKLFMVDLAAPLFTSFTYKVMLRAQTDGIKRLYFCARDAGTIYKIAEKLHPLFPECELHYLFISRDALYKGNAEARSLYFQQCGLASKDERCAIVDLRTSGKTLCVLNNQLKNEGFLPVKGYFFEIFCTGTISNIPDAYYAELQSPYYTRMPSCRPMFNHHYLVEMYISVHNERRTIDYQLDNDNRAWPIYADEETEFSEDSAAMLNSAHRCKEHRNIMLAFTSYFVETKLYKHVNDVFAIAIRQWGQFSDVPNVKYLNALEDFYSSKPNETDRLPYVKKMNMIELLLTRGNQTLWKQASILYSLPTLLRLLYVMKLKKH